jgi:hypothetical protein
LRANIAKLPEAPAEVRYRVDQPNFYLSRQARVYDSGVGPGTNALFLLMDSGSMAPTMFRAHRLGR